MNITNLVLLYEQVMLEYSEGFLKQQVERLQKQNVHATPETIKQMLQRFDQLKTAGNTKQEIKNIITTDIESGIIKAKNPKDQKRVDNLKRSPWNVEFYDFPELEKVVHSFRDVGAKQAQKDLEKASTTDTGAELAYETPDHMLQVFYAKDAKSANAFKLWLAKNKQQEIKQANLNVNLGTGRGLYGWCVSSPLDRGNLFASYRFCHGDRSASLYFVLDNKLPVTNNKHIIVVHAYKNGTYLVTGANNDGDKPMSWAELVGYQPALKKVNKDIFKFQPYTEEEQLYLLTKDARPEDFKGFTPRVKKAYIDLGPNNKIYSQDYINLVNVDPNLPYVQRQEAEKFGSDLQHAYINVRSPNANDPDFMSRILKLLNLFQDTNMTEVNTRIQQAKKLAAKTTDENDLSWEEPLFQDKAMLQTKDKGVLKYWKKLIDDSLRGLGSAKRADS
jgi:hypothetical protein